MSASGTVTIRFDVQGNEKLLQSLTTLATGASQATTGVTKLQSTLGGIGVGNLGPLNNIATSVKNAGTAMGAAETKVTSFKTKLAGIGTQLGANATSFGVATASIWGVYNAYDSLEKVQIRAHAAAVKVETLETSLAALTERRRIAVEKGNLTGEQLRILNEKIADTTEKLSVAQERSADVAQDVQEAWAGFISTVGPQAIAATGSIIQLANTFKGSFANTGGVFNTVKNAIIGLIPSLKAAKAESLLLSPALGGIATSGTSLKTVATGLASGISPLASGFKGLASSVLSLKAPLGGIATAAPTAATGIISMGSGLTGLDGKLKGAGTSAVGLKGSLLGLGITVGVIGLVTAGALELAGAMNKLALETSHIKTPVSALEATMDKTGKSMQTFQQTVAETEAEARAGVTPLIFALDAVFGTHMRENILKSAGALDAHGKIIVDWDKKAQTIPASMNAAATSSNAMVNAIIVLRTQMEKHQITTTQYIDALAKLKIPGDQFIAIMDEVNARMKAAATLVPTATQNMKDFGSAGGEVFDTISNLAPGMIEVEKNTRELNAALVAGWEEVLRADPIYQGFGNTLGELQIQFSKLHAEAAKPIAFPSAAQNLTQQVPGPFGGNPTAITKKTDLADVKARIAATEEEEAAIVKLGQKYGVASIEFDKFIKNGVDDTAMMNELISKTINYTSALDDQATNQKLVAEGFRDGIIQAKGFFDNLVKGTEQEAQFNAAVAEGAYTLGIHSDMLSFTSTKSQELIKSVYAMQKGYLDMSLAASKSTAFLQDNEIIQAQVTQGMIEGRTAANDWAVSLDKSVASEKAEHEQLLHLTADMTGLSIPMSLTNDQLKEVMTNFKETGDAAGSLANVVTENLAPAFDLVSGLLDAKSFKDFGKALKDLALPKGFLKAGKDMDDAMKSMFNASKNAEKAENAIKLLTTVDLKEEDFKKKLTTIKDSLESLQKVPGTTPAIDNILKQAEKMSRTDFIKHAGSLNMIFDAINQYGFLPDDIASAALKLFDEENAKVDPSGGNAVKGLNAVATSAKAASLAMMGFHKVQNQASINGKPTQAFSIEPTIIKKPTSPEEITPPEPIVFPPPDMHNITDAISKIEVDIGSMVDFAANLVLAFPPMDISTIDEGITTAEEDLGSIIDFTAGLVAAFPKPNIEQINAGLVEAENNLGSIIDFVAALKTVFPKPDTKLVLMAATQANAQIKSVATFISSSAMKLTFQKPDIKQIESQVKAATTSMKSLEGIASGLRLKFPKPNISEIEKGVNEAQAKINSLKGTTVTNHVKTVFDNAGGNILNDVKIMSAAAGKLFTTNGEQLFRVGDNPGGRETIAMIPHDKPHEIMDRLMKMFPPITSTLRERARRPSMQTVSGGISGGGGQRSGPTVVNVTTEVYLFPGSAQFKKYIKSIMLEGLSGLPIV